MTTKPTAKRRKPGRPPKKSADRLVEVIRVRLTKDQRRRFEAAAASDRRDLADWLRVVAENKADEMGVK